MEHFLDGEMLHSWKIKLRKTLSRAMGIYIYELPLNSYATINNIVLSTE
jgi:hypothetical protein